jgi:hypothetical protein
MRSKRGKSQLLPTPQNSTTSTKEEDKFLLSSEVDEVEVEVEVDGVVGLGVGSVAGGLNKNLSNVNSVNRVNSMSSAGVKSERNLRSNSYNSYNDCNNFNSYNSYNDCNNSNSYNDCNNFNSSYNIFNLKKPRLLRGKSKIISRSSSWPFRSWNSGDKFGNNFVYSFNPMSKKEMIKLKRLIQRDFPYDRVIEGLSEKTFKLLFDEDLWRFLLKISTIFTGESVQGDRQKRNEVAFAAWTTLLRVYGRSPRMRGGGEQVQKMAVASIVLQSKLLEESDVDLVKLERKMEKLTRTKVSFEKRKIEVCERRICSLLGWKLLVPSPQVLLFSILDSLNLPSSLKLLVSKVMDQLIEGFFLHDHLRDCAFGKMVNLVISVIEIVLCDFFSVFQSDQIDPQKLLKESLPVQAVPLTADQREEIEKAIETVMCSI